MANMQGNYRQSQYHSKECYEEMHARLPKLSDHCFFPFFLLPLPGPWSVSWCLSCWISSSCSANREFMLENLNLNLRSAGCTFFIFISPCQVFAHDTKLCLIACCSSCSLLSQPPLLPLQSANRDGLSSQRKSPLHLALSSSIFSPSLLLCNSLAVAASNSKLKATALLSASRRLPTLICVSIFFPRFWNNLPVLQSCSPRRFSTPLLLQS